MVHLQICGFTVFAESKDWLSISPVADPGFPIRGRRRPMRALFAEDKCENEKIGYCWGGGGLDPPMITPQA